MTRTFACIALVVLLGCGGAGTSGVNDALPPDTATDTGQVDTGLVDIPTEDLGQDLATEAEVASGPLLVLHPAIIDYGHVPPKPGGSVKTLRLRNHHKAEGTLVLHKDAIQLQPESPEYKNLFLSVSGGFAGKSLPADEMHTEPGENLFVNVQWNIWTPIQPVDNQGFPIGHILITSNDETQGIVQVDIFGRISLPKVTLVPEDLDFLTVGSGVTAKRTLTLNNEGQYDLVINSGGLCMEILGDELDGIPGEFAYEVTDGFPPTDPANCGTGTIPPNEGRTIDVSFTNLGPGPSPATATLRFTTNDPSNWVVEVPLTAKKP